MNLLMTIGNMVCYLEKPHLFIPIRKGSDKVIEEPNRLLQSKKIIQNNI